MDARATLTIDTGAIVKNWQLLSSRFSGEECGAVVKADAYGLGMKAIAPALAKAGCHTFFVATFDEAMQLRDVLPDVRIVIFHGAAEGEQLACVNNRLIPALANHAQIERWQEVAKRHEHAVSMLHIDTGMARLGLQPEDFFALLSNEPDLLKTTRAAGVMSHLACAPSASHPLNAKQLSAMQQVKQACAALPVSLCNSGGIFLGDDYHFDLARPGCSLYGIRPSDHDANPMHQVASWRAPILQIRTLAHDQTVGYGATQTLKAGSKIATVASGYADGYLRTLTHQSSGYVGDIPVPLVGRVTMDMLSFNVSSLPDSVLEQAETIELLGDKDGIRVDDLADHAQTIGYEVFTRIGARVVREYI